MRFTGFVGSSFGSFVSSAAELFPTRTAAATTHEETFFRPNRATGIHLRRGCYFDVHVGTESPFHRESVAKRETISSVSVCAENIHE
jgi:hypothetical protein